MITATMIAANVASLVADGTAEDAFAALLVDLATNETVDLSLLAELARQLSATRCRLGVKCFQEDEGEQSCYPLDSMVYDGCDIVAAVEDRACDYDGESGTVTWFLDVGYTRVTWCEHGAW